MDLLALNGLRTDKNPVVDFHCGSSGSKNAIISLHGVFDSHWINLPLINKHQNKLFILCVSLLLLLSDHKLQIHTLYHRQGTDSLMLAYVVLSVRRYGPN